MSIDRRIGLDTAIAQGSGLAQSDAQTSGRQASDADKHAFEQAMARGKDESPVAPPAAPSPFSLFGARLPTPHRRPWRRRCKAAPNSCWWPMAARAGARCGSN